MGADAEGGHSASHHTQSFWEKYVFSTDHKVIAKQFLITAIIWAVIGGAFSVIFRLQLGFQRPSWSGCVRFSGIG